MPLTLLDAPRAIELVSILEFFAGWLRADLHYARARHPLDGTHREDDLQADIARLIDTLEAT